VHLSAAGDHFIFVKKKKGNPDIAILLSIASSKKTEVSNEMREVVFKIGGANVVMHGPGTHTNNHHG
jgi:hypothetical protein